MSCHGCASSFGFFCREHACENCGFSFCNKCLRWKCMVPKLGSEQHVCRPCYAALVEHVGEPAVEKEYSPPSAFLSDASRRLESLEDPNRPPITVYQHDQRMEQLKTGLEEPDRQIAERLEKLRDDMKRKPVPTEEEVVRRLQQLKGQRSLPAGKVDRSVDLRTDEEKVDSLIQQFVEERELDSKRPNPDQEIAARLAKLRLQGHDVQRAGGNEQMECESGQEQSDEVAAAGLETASLDEVTALLLQVQEEIKGEDESGAGSKDKRCLTEMRSKLEAKHSEISGTDLDEEGHIQKIISWAMAEAKLKRWKSSDVSSEDELSTSSDERLSDEIEICIICDKDATLKCKGCSGDLYCNDCFVSGHDQWDMKDHVAVEYGTPQNTE